MLSLFSVYNINLNQLSVCLLVDDCLQANKSIILNVYANRLELVFGDKTLPFIFDEYIRLEPTTFRQFNVLTIKQKNCTRYQLSFTINVKFAALERTLKDVQLPVNYELLSDWIFCHNHNHSCNEEKSINNSSKQSIDDSLHKEHLPIRSSEQRNFIFTSLDQITRLFYENSNSQYLFESENCGLNLIINIINPNAISYNCSSSNLNENLENIKLNFQNILNVTYKLIKIEDQINSELEELSRYRRSFQVEWFPLKDQIFSELTQELVLSTKRLLPLDARFDAHSQFVYGYLDLVSIFV